MQVFTSYALHKQLKAWNSNHGCFSHSISFAKLFNAAFTRDNACSSTTNFHGSNILPCIRLDVIVLDCIQVTATIMTTNSPHHPSHGTNTNSTSTTIHIGDSAPRVGVRIISLRRLQGKRVIKSTNCIQITTQHGYPKTLNTQIFNMHYLKLLNNTIYYIIQSEIPKKTWLERRTSHPKVTGSNPTESHRVMIFLSLSVWKNSEELHL